MTNAAGSRERGFDSIGMCIRLSYGEPECNRQRNRLRQVSQPLHRAVIRVYDAADNVIETHEHKGDFKEP